MKQIIKKGYINNKNKYSTELAYHFKFFDIFVLEGDSFLDSTDISG